MDDVAVFRALKIIAIAFGHLFALAMVFMVVLFASLIFGCFDTPIKNRVVSNPVRDFEAYTGLSWPKGAAVVLAEDSHWNGQSGTAFAIGPGLLDGHLMIILDADPEVIHTWVTENPEDHGRPWKSGHVPPSVPFLEAWRPGEEIRNASNFYTGDISGNDGTLLVVDPKSGRVWLSQWNM